jgi:hypothetical protein
LTVLLPDNESGTHQRTMTNTYATLLTAQEIRIAILELGEKYGEHDVLSMILRGMNINELRENLDYLTDEFAS